MTKKKKILRLHKKNFPPYKISQLVGCSRQYVFLVLRHQPANWSEIRQLILKRDANTCQLEESCKGESNTKLHVHHIDFNPQNNDSNNLITLCSKCHANYHGRLKENPFGVIKKCCKCKKEFFRKVGKSRYCPVCYKATRRTRPKLF